MELSRRRLLRATGTSVAFGTALRGAVSTASAHAPIRDEFDPAHPTNYGSANRTSGDVRWVVMHTIEGSYEAGIGTFKNPSSNVSSHFVIGNQPGQITQMVDMTDISYTAGNYDYNATGAHIEMEGTADVTEFNDTLYRQAAQAVRWICDEYDVPKRHPTDDIAPCSAYSGEGGIIGHEQIPDPANCNRVVDGKPDPGSTWDWDYFVSLVRDGSGGGGGGGGGGGKFESDERVKTTANSGLVIHSRPALSAPTVWTAPEGSAGYVRGGPRRADGYVWWKVGFNAGYEGWCVQEYLTEAPLDGGGGDDGDDDDGGDDDRATPGNVRALAKVLTTEAGRGICKEVERTAVGYTVVNRMDDAGTDSVQDVWDAYAYGKPASEQSKDLAREILTGDAPDRTDGAIYFYSARSMPAAGEPTGGYDVRGGLEWVPGLSQRHYRPGWGRDNEQVYIEGVRPHFFKFFEEASARSLPDYGGGVSVGDTVTAGSGGATAYDKPRGFSATEGSVRAGTTGTVVGDGIVESGDTIYAKIHWSDGTTGHTPVGALREGDDGGGDGGDAPDPKFEIGEDVVSTAAVNVRSSAEVVADNVKHTQPEGERGTVKNGYITEDGYTWWWVEWANGVGGWSVQRYLAADSRDGGAGEGGKGGSGPRTERGRVEAGESVFYTHSPKSSTDELAISLDGAGGSDLDLYVTYDGRRPERKDFDEKSAGRGSSETLTLSGGSLSGKIGVLVDAYERSDKYTLEFTPRSTGGGDGGSGDGGGDGDDDGSDDGGLDFIDELLRILRQLFG